MSWKGHLVLGIVFLMLATFVVYALSNWTELIVFDLIFILFGWGVGAYCSLLPDIDTRISKVFGFTLTILLLLMIWFIVNNQIIELIVLIVFLLLLLLLSHRGITHKWYISFVVGVLVTFIFMSVIVGIFAFFGYFSHAGFEKSH